MENYSITLIRQYIALRSSKVDGFNTVYYCTILGPDLKIKTSFKLKMDDGVDFTDHVFTKARGLVCGDFDGRIHITKFTGWEPNETTVASGAAGAAGAPNNLITALSTREDLIVGGSMTGFGIWNYDGIQLCAVESPPIVSICIRQTKLLIGTDRLIKEFRLPTPETKPTVWELELVRDIPTDKDQSWATYDSGCTNISHCPVQDKSEPFRPLIPTSGEYDILFLAPGMTSYEGVQQDVVVRNLVTGELICRFQVEPNSISWLWCDHRRIFWIAEEPHKISMLDLVRDDQEDTFFEIVECFSLHIQSQM